MDQHQSLHNIPEDRECSLQSLLPRRWTVFIIAFTVQKTESVHHGHYCSEDRECSSSLLSSRESIHHGHYCPDDRECLSSSSLLPRRQKVLVVIIITAQKMDSVHHSHYCPEDRDCSSSLLLSRKQIVHHSHYCPEDRVYPPWSLLSRRQRVFIMVITIQKTEIVYHGYYYPEDRECSSS